MSHSGGHAGYYARIPCDNCARRSVACYVINDGSSRSKCSECQGRSLVCSFDLHDVADDRGQRPTFEGRSYQGMAFPSSSTTTNSSSSTVQYTQDRAAYDRASVVSQDAAVLSRSSNQWEDSYNDGAAASSSTRNDSISYSAVDSESKGTGVVPGHPSLSNSYNHYDPAYQSQKHQSSFSTGQGARVAVSSGQEKHHVLSYLAQLAQHRQQSQPSRLGLAASSSSDSPMASQAGHHAPAEIPFTSKITSPVPSYAHSHAQSQGQHHRQAYQEPDTTSQHYASNWQSSAARVSVPASGSQIWGSSQVKDASNDNATAAPSLPASSLYSNAPVSDLDFDNVSNENPEQPATLKQRRKREPRKSAKAKVQPSTNEVIGSGDGDSSQKPQIYSEALSAGRDRGRTTTPQSLPSEVPTVSGFVDPSQMFLQPPTRFSDPPSSETVDNDVSMAAARVVASRRGKGKRPATEMDGTMPFNEAPAPSGNSRKKSKTSRGKTERTQRDVAVGDVELLLAVVTPPQSPHASSETIKKEKGARQKRGKYDRVWKDLFIERIQSLRFFGNAIEEESMQEEFDDLVGQIESMVDGRFEEEGQDSQEGIQAPDR
ncbi:hypothetical protein IE53DRAFT_366019 [Violaceomyces palustris]|uniref:Uncharacterized protein n=1 Tax=Violaceomyces palustris TaxID=1673888 RepID=A0ACD0P742_9BASI|nr:hypothetical protein IE53DRAFT_366019 [Violaceomyces palustris]